MDNKAIHAGQKEQVLGLHDDSVIEVLRYQVAWLGVSRAQCAEREARCALIAR